MSKERNGRRKREKGKKGETRKGKEENGNN